MKKPHVPGALLEAFNAKQQKHAKKHKVAMPAKGEMGMVMKRAKKGSKLFGTKNIKKKGAAHTASRTGFDAAGEDTHEEKHSTKKGKKHKHSKRCKHAKKA